METRVVVTGAGGFIGSHLVQMLKSKGYWVRGVDLKLPEFSTTAADEFIRADLREPGATDAIVAGMDEVCALAADMGGMGYISSHHATILRNNALINLNTLESARRAGVERYLYTSSACVYPEHLQVDTDVAGLREEDAYPAAPQDAYGWEKLMTEKACGYYADEFGLDVRIVRFHNVYGPKGTYEGGREKAPAALCRKVAQVEDGGSVEIWGDGKQTRSFCYIDDCIEGIYRLLRSSYTQPLNLGSDEMVAIDELAEMIIAISGKRNVGLVHVDGPQGVRGRNSDNTRLRSVLGWEPSTALAAGLASTYQWIEQQVNGSQRAAA